jgi:hypothetical protein
MRRSLQIHLPRRLSIVLLAIFTLLAPYALAWNIPTHMLSGAIAYQTLRSESPSTIADVKTTLESHPWFESHWRTQLEKLPAADRDEMLFMLAARWADDIRMKDRSQNRGPWHYINLPFKPDGEPDSVKAKPPGTVNIVTALNENGHIVRSQSDPQKRAIALTWLFHLFGDIHQPLHTTALFTVDYPDGDRGGNEICARPAPNRKAIDLHRFWDGVITLSSNFTRPHNETIVLRNRPGFARDAYLSSADRAMKLGLRKASRSRRKLHISMAQCLAPRKDHTRTAAT